MDGKAFKLRIDLYFSITKFSMLLSSAQMYVLVPESYIFNAH